MPSRLNARSHLAPFTEGPRPYLILAGNAIPVIGVYYFEWVKEVIVFQIWFDAVIGLGAMVAFQLRAFLIHDKQNGKLPMDVAPDVLPWVVPPFWLLLWVLTGLPFWFLLLFYSPAIFNGELVDFIVSDRGLQAVLLLLVLFNCSEQYGRHFERMSDHQIKLEFNWEYMLLLARFCILLLMPFFLNLGMVVLLMVALSYIEIYPMRSLRFLDGDVNLFEENRNRSLD